MCEEKEMKCCGSQSLKSKFLVCRQCLLTWDVNEVGSHPKENQLDHQGCAELITAEQREENISKRVFFLCCCTLIFLNYASI